MKRITCVGRPHHIVQRGVAGQPLFNDDDDYLTYRSMIATSCRRYSLAVWAYCLMPDHVHLVVVPRHTDSLARGLGNAHSRYARHANGKRGRQGAVWQRPYAAHLLDDQALIQCVRYVEINAEKRGYVERPWQWRWCSAAAHCAAQDDELVTVAPLLQRVTLAWQPFLEQPRPPEEAELFYAHEKSGLPLGSTACVEQMIAENN